jgi:pimeloyl-ACP methyl ester carboxylesterase
MRMPMLQVQGAELHYTVEGQGPPLLLIAGTACDGTYWSRFQVPDFARDFSVITFDQRGTGRSVTEIEDYSTNRLAADCAAVITAVGRGPAIVWGHSMGGRVAQLVALDHGEHVRALVLASTGSSFKAKGGIAAKTFLGFSKAFVGANATLVSSIMNEMMATLPPVEVYFAHILSRQDHETTARLQFIRCPTLVMVGGDETHGTSDTTHVDSSRILARAIPGAQFEVLEGEGHFYSHSAPELTSRLVRAWLSSSGIV